ncbi:MAG: polyphosphate polymerase domain-containing protein [Velocimicrobium sp.]
MLDERRYEILCDCMKEHMTVDDYGLSTICNVYYDTNNYELIRTSIEKPPYKEKMRIRSYGVPKETDKTFVEIKKKYDGIVYKRRIQLSVKEARNYLEHGIKPPKDSQILKEIDYFINFYHPVKRMYIAYDRVAMFGIEDDSIRITFDRNIRSREYDLDLVRGDFGELLLDQSQVLMEIKVAGAYPLWMVRILSELKIYPVSFSKYGAIYQQKMKEERNQKICLPA